MIFFRTSLGLPEFFSEFDRDYVCALPGSDGMASCSNLQPFGYRPSLTTSGYSPCNDTTGLASGVETSINPQQYYYYERRTPSPQLTTQSTLGLAVTGEGGWGFNESWDGVEMGLAGNGGCVDWNQYYTRCGAADENPFHNSVSFDNIGYAWIAIFQVD